MTIKLGLMQNECGYVVKQMSQRIERTNDVIAFITTERRYIETINCEDPNDNCKLEFDYTSRTNKKFKNGCSYHGNMCI